GGKNREALLPAMNHRCYRRTGAVARFSRVALDEDGADDGRRCAEDRPRFELIFRDKDDRNDAHEKRNVDVAYVIADKHYRSVLAGLTGTIHVDIHRLEHLAGPLGHDRVAQPGWGRAPVFRLHGPELPDIVGRHVHDAHEPYELIEGARGEGPRLKGT